jgi:predicted neutral ceramidase superfamily lipid hydrolase
VIAQPWRNPYKAVFFLIAAAYTALSVLDTVFLTIKALESWMVVVFCLVIFFCVGTIVVNLKTIKRHDVRTVSNAIIILSFVMMPLLVVTCSSRLCATSPTVVLHGLLDHHPGLLFIYFRRIPQEVPKVLTIESLEKYHITEREFSVIQLIKAGRPTRK